MKEENLVGDRHERYRPVLTLSSRSGASELLGFPTANRRELARKETPASD